MSRLQRVLLVLLVVQAAAWAVLAFWGESGRGQGGKPLLAGLDAARVVRLVVSDSQGDSVVVTRSAEGWGLGDFGGYPADSAKAEGLLRRLAELKGTSPAVESDRYHASLEVAPESYQRRLTLYHEGAEQAHEIWIGRSPSPGLVYARVTGSDAVFEVEGLETYEVPAAAAAWIRGRIFEFDPTLVQRLSLRNRAGSFAAERTPEGWTLREPAAHAGRALDAGRVDAFLRAVSSIYAVEPIGRTSSDDAGFEAEFVVEVDASGDSAEPEARGVRIGAPLGGEVPHRPVATWDSPFLAAVHENSLFRILNETWTDLLP